MSLAARVFVGLLFGLAGIACSTAERSGPAVLGHIEAVNTLEDGGILIRYDLKSDGRPLRFEVHPLGIPEQVVATLESPEIGKDRRVFISASQLGPWIHDRLQLEIVLKDDATTVFAASRAR